MMRTPPSSTALVTQPGVAAGAFAFNAFQLNPAHRMLVRDGEAVRLGGRAFDLLTVLIEHAGEVVSKQKLFARVWPGVFVEDANLRLQIGALRKALGCGASGERFIQTVPGRGYSFVGGVNEGHEAISKAAAPGACEGPRNLPAPLTRIVGRDKALDLIVDRLQRRRFVTIVGPGGVGKTTVALAAADSLIGDYEDGVRFLDVGPLADRWMVASALACELGVAADPNDPLPEVLAHLRTKSMLIVLDNCEHVVGQAAALAEGILARTLGVHVLATSREPLRAEGESVHRLATLAAPSRSAGAHVAGALAFPAVELFVERASAALDTFVLEDRNLAQVCEICRRLDGMPLAIEIVAARVDLGLDVISARLADSSFLHAKGRRTAGPRQQTLCATLDWSHDSLSDAEQIVFRRLAPMVGGFTADAAVAVVADALVEASDAPLILADLYDKSLVATDFSGRTVQYRLFEIARAYAAEKLAQSGEADSAALRHAVYFLQLMRRADAEWEARRGGDWLSTYRGAIDNVRAAIDWSLASASDEAIGLELTVASAELWFQLSLTAEYRERVEFALRRLQAAADPQPALEMRLQAALGHPREGRRPCAVARNDKRSSPIARPQSHVGNIFSSALGRRPEPVLMPSRKV